MGSRQLEAQGEDEGAYFQPRIEAGTVSEFSGSASYSHALQMPTGAGGMSIPLSLHYSSNTVNNKWGDHKADGSWVGVGWKLDVGRIEIAGDDTTMTLNGKSQELIHRDPYPNVTAISCPPSSGAWHCKNAKTEHLRARLNGFNKVLKHVITWEREDFNPHRISEVRNDATYEVWDQSGTRYDFGKRRFQGLPANGWWDWDWQEEVKDYSRTYMVARDVWVSWTEFMSFGLDRVVDVHGNTINIDYVSYADDGWRDVGGGGMPHFSRQEIYPSLIRYTRNASAGDNQEEYEVEFITARKGFSDGDNDTVHAQVSQSGVVLQRIKMWFVPDGGGPRVLLREYVFDYAIDSDPDARGSRSYRLTKIDQYGKGGQASGHKLPSTTFSYDRKTLRWNNLDHHRWYLTGIGNGRGGDRSFTYQDKALNRTIQHVVSQAQTDPGTGPSIATSYSYFDAKHTTNEEKNNTQTLNGFAKVHRIAGDLRVESRFHAYNTIIDDEGDDNTDDFPLQGRSKSVLSEIYPAGTNLKKVETTWQVDDLDEGGKHVYASQTLEKVWGDDGRPAPVQEGVRIPPQGSELPSAVWLQLVRSRAARAAHTDLRVPGGGSALVSHETEPVLRQRRRVAGRSRSTKSPGQQLDRRVGVPQHRVRRRQPRTGMRAQRPWSGLCQSNPGIDVVESVDRSEAELRRLRQRCLVDELLQLRLCIQPGQRRRGYDDHGLRLELPQLPDSEHQCTGAHL